MNGSMQQIIQAMQTGKTQVVMELTEDMLRKGVAPKDIIEKALLPTAYELGEEYQARSIPITTVLIASRAMLACIHILTPELSRSKYNYKGKVIIGTVAGDVHDLGKTLVIATLSAVGMEVIDLGVDVTPERFLESVIEYKPDVVAMSCLLTTTLDSIRLTMELLKKPGLRQNVIILIGGRPVTEKFAQSVGADLYAPDAYSAAQKLITHLPHQENFKQNLCAAISSNPAR